MAGNLLEHPHGLDIDDFVGLLRLALWLSKRNIKVVFDVWDECSEDETVRVFLRWKRSGVSTLSTYIGPVGPRHYLTIIN